jgi:hypothetical protein
MSEKEVIEFREAIQHNITIKPSANGGYIVRVGCVTLCFNNSQMLIEALDEYLKNPEGVEKRYNESKGNINSPITSSPQNSNPSSGEPILMARFRNNQTEDQPQCESPS